MNFLRFNADSLNSKEWEKAWGIYNYSFPEHEKRTLQTQALFLKEEDYFCCGIMKNENFCGIIFCWRFKNKLYIEHLAVANEFRGLGVGTEVLEYLKEQKENIILEVDPQMDEVAKRRVRFYKRLGFKENTYEYYHPPLSEKRDPYCLEVMSYPSALADAEFKDFVKFINSKPVMYKDGLFKHFV